MSTPSEKSPKIERLLDNFTRRNFGRNRMDSISGNVCVTCGKAVDILKFRDSMSTREYKISGMCQECQDSVFGT